MNAVDKLRAELLSMFLDCSQVERVNATLKIDAILGKFDVVEKCTELSVDCVDNRMVLLKNFLGTKRLEGRSKSTIELYRLYLTKFLNTMDRRITEITTNDIRQYLASYQVNNNVTVVTVNNLRNTLSSFFSWLYAEGYVTSNPMVRVIKFKVPKPHIKPYTAVELASLYDAAESVRDRALVEFLYSTGCRVSECSNINMTDVNFVTRTVLVNHGKGGLTRTVYLSDTAIHWLNRYINECRPDDAGEALWISRKGKRLSKEGIEALVTRLGAKAGVYKATPHRFRHTLASNLCSHGVPVQVVQQILGHDNINTTMIYVTTDTSAPAAAHKQFL